MLDILFKKKVSEDKVAKHFVGGLIQLVDQVFPEVAQLINDDPSFVRRPQIDPRNSDEFLMIVIAGNMKFIPKLFNDYQDVRITKQCYKLFSEALGLSPDQTQQLIATYQSFFTRINHPSKNTHYAMSKAVFYKYELNNYQEDYFKNMKTPNPVFLKRLDEITAHFIWDWEGIQDKFRIVQ